MLRVWRSFVQIFEQNRRGLSRLQIPNAIKNVLQIVTATTIGITVMQLYVLRDTYNKSEKLPEPSGPKSGSERFKDRVRLIKEKLLNKTGADISNDQIRNEENKIEAIVKISKQIFQELELKEAFLKEKLIKTKDDVKESLTKKKEEVKDQLKKKFMTLKEKIDFFNEKKEAKLSTKRIDRGSAMPSISIPVVNRRIKLVVIGDSLVTGVGCQEGKDGEETSPILPRILANALSVALEADVQWQCEGLTGACIQDIKNSLLPSVKESVLLPLNFLLDKKQAKDDRETDLVVVIICGLNDWKTMIIDFPFGKGISGFKEDLQSIVLDILKSSQGRYHSCKVYLPALPVYVGSTDPSFAPNVAPLKFLFQLMCSIFDNQKQGVASENKPGSVMYVTGDVDMTKSYATPGIGNISSDGIHPSVQGYKWWALHIAEEILKSIK